MDFMKENGEQVDINDIPESVRGSLLLREHGVVERLCQHGVGHPVGHANKWDGDWMGVHGCDGCCIKGDWGKDGLQ